jgi:hypothetical protein
MAEIKDLPITEVISDLSGFIEDIDNPEKYPGSDAKYSGKTIGQAATIILKEKFNLTPAETKDLVWATNKLKDTNLNDYDLNTAVSIRNKAFEKIQSESTGIKVKDYSPLIPRGEGVTAIQRVIGGYIPKDDLHNYLRKQGYEVQIDPKTQRTLVRRPNEASFSEFNPNRIDVMDFVDKLPEAAEAVLTGFSTSNPAIGIPLQSAYGGASEAARQYVSQKVGGRPEGDFDYGSIATSAGLSGLLGAGAEVIGAIGKRAIPAVKEIAATRNEVRKTADVMKDAASKLGFTFTKEELSRSPIQRNLFDAINRADDSVIGYLTGENAQRKLMSNRTEQLDSIAEAILDEASKSTGAKSMQQLKNASVSKINYGVGKEVRDTIADTIKQKKQASEFFYDRVKKALNVRDAQADLTSFEAAAKRLRRESEGSITAENAIDSLVEYIGDGKSLKAIANIRSDLLSKARVAAKNGDAQSARINGKLAEMMKDVEHQTYETLIDKFSQGAEKEFIGNAKEAAKYANKNIEGMAETFFPPNKNVAKLEATNLMKKDLQSARNMWREANDEAEKFYKATGEKWTADLGPKIEKIASEAPEKSLNRLVPKNDMEKSLLMKERYPDMYKRAQKATKAKEVQDILNTISLRQVRSKADWSTTLEKLSKLGNEDLSILLGKDSREKLKALQTVYKYAPEVINASGTKINANIIDGSLLGDSKTAFKRYLLKQAYKVGESEKLTKAFSFYTTPVKQTTKAVGQAAISREGAE